MAASAQALFALAKAILTTLHSVLRVAGWSQPACQAAAPQIRQGLPAAAAPIAATRQEQRQEGGDMREIGRVSAGSAAGPGRTGARGRAGFALGPEAGQIGTEAPAGPAAANAATSVGLGLLGLQEGGERATRDHAARRRAESILQELQSLQRDLLHDGPDMNRLERLAAFETGEEGADPFLRDAVEAIVLRARVELARRGWNASVSKK